MKTLATFLFAVALLSLFGSYGFASMAPTKTVSGRVAAVSSDAIVVDVGSGKNMLDVGAIVQPDTKVMVNGKSAPVADLAQKVKTGDMVTLNYVETNDLYATRITKK